MNQKGVLFIGIDAGGTKTRLAFKHLDDDTNYVDGPGINFQRDGLEQTVEVSSQLISTVIERTGGVQEVIACVGIAGAGRKIEQEEIAEALTKALHFSSNQVHVLSDADIAFYGAHGDNSGILIIIGTGSIILARTRNVQMVRAGGWGFLLGDEAGGYRLAQAGLSAVANALDGGPKTSILQLLSQEHEISDRSSLIELVYQKGKKIQHFAPLVIEAAAAGDQVALHVVDQQLSQLASQLTWLMDQHQEIDLRVSFAGGVSKSKFYISRLKEQILLRIPEAKFVPPRSAPALAALELALKLDFVHLDKVSKLKFKR